MQSLRDRIVTAAEAICLREGVARMSMRKVAGEVGVSATAIYGHFESKQALLNEIVAVGLRSLGTYLRPALGAESAHLRLRRLCERFLDFAREQPEHSDLAFLDPDIDRKHHGFLNFRYLWETGVRNNPEGNLFVVTASFPIPGVSVQ